MLCLVPFCFSSKSSSLLSSDHEIASLGPQFSVTQSLAIFSPSGAFARENNLTWPLPEIIQMTFSQRALK